MGLHTKGQWLSLPLAGSSADFLLCLEVALLHASLTLLLAPAGCVKHVLITVKEKDKRASTNMPDLLGPKFRTDTLTCLLYFSGQSKSCGQAQSQSEWTLESDMAKDLATRRDKLGPLMLTGSCAVARALVRVKPCWHQNKSLCLVNLAELLFFIFKKRKTILTHRDLANHTWGSDLQMKPMNTDVCRAKKLRKRSLNTLGD